MTSAVQAVLDAATELSPTEQLELIQGMVEGLHHRLTQPITTDFKVAPGEIGIPASVRRTPPVNDLARLAADFWPEDETADDINAFISKQRAVGGR